MEGRFAGRRALVTRASRGIADRLAAIVDPKDLG
jgi:hypothetical protein